MADKKKRRLNEWLRKHNVDKPHYCLTCGKQIIATERHYRNHFKIPKYHTGHNPKNKKSSNKTKQSKNHWDTLSEEEKQEILDRLSPFLSGENNPNYGDGTFINSSGYRYILFPEHPLATANYVLEHRLVVEEYLRENEPNSEHLIEIGGEKYLDPEKVVHHCNEIKTDNRVENLMVLTPSAHVFLHSSKLPLEEKLKIIESGKFRK